MLFCSSWCFASNPLILDIVDKGHHMCLSGYLFVFSLVKDFIEAYAQ